MRKKGHRDNRVGGRRREGSTGNAPLPGETPQNDADKKGDADFPDLYAEYRDVLEWFCTPLGQRGDAPEGFDTRVNALREDLYPMVFNYTSALVMLGWAFPAPPSEAMQKLIRKGDDSGSSEDELIVQSTKDIGGGRKSWVDPWNEFAESEIADGVVWIDLLVDASDLWDSVPRPEIWEDLPDSAWGGLIRLFKDASKNSQSAQDPNLSVEVQFRDARDAAWSVLVRETLKWLLGSRKHIATSHAEAQLNRDAFMIDRFISSFRVGWNLDHKEQVKTLMEGLTSRRAGKGAASLKTDPGKVSDRISRIRDEWREPRWVLTTALHWTSADCPLCLMSSAAAAATVFEIHYGTEGKTLGDRPDEKTFRNRFGTMTDDLNLLQFFSRRGRGKSQAAVAAVVKATSVARTDRPSPEGRPLDADRAPCEERRDLLQKTLAEVVLRGDLVDQLHSQLSSLRDAGGWPFDFRSLGGEEKCLSKVATQIKKFEQLLADLLPRQLSLSALLIQARVDLEEEIETLEKPQGKAEQDTILTLTVSEAYLRKGIESLELKISGKGLEWIKKEKAPS